MPQGIEARPDRRRVFSELLDTFIRPSMQAVQAGDYDTALDLYARGVTRASEYAAA